MRCAEPKEEARTSSLQVGRHGEKPRLRAGPKQAPGRPSSYVCHGGARLSPTRCLASQGVNSAAEPHQGDLACNGSQPDRQPCIEAHHTAGTTTVNAPAATSSRQGMQPAARGRQRGGLVSVHGHSRTRHGGERGAQRRRRQLLRVAQLSLQARGEGQAGGNGNSRPGPAPAPALLLRSMLLAGGSLARGQCRGKRD